MSGLGTADADSVATRRSPGRIMAGETPEREDRTSILPGGAIEKSVRHTEHWRCLSGGGRISLTRGRNDVCVCVCVRPCMCINIPVI